MRSRTRSQSRRRREIDCTRQANQLGEPDVVRLIDLLAVAVEDARQGGDARLPLELALVKVTRPGADLSRESLAYRVEQLENRPARVPAKPSEPPTEEPRDRPADVETETAPETESETNAEIEPEGESTGPPLELDQLQNAWVQAVLPAVEQRSIPTANLLSDARPVELANDRLVVEFPASASFHRGLAEDPKNASLLQEVLHEVTGRRLSLAFEVNEERSPESRDHDDGPAGEDRIVALLRDEFDAHELDE